MVLREDMQLDGGPAKTNGERHIEQPTHNLTADATVSHINDPASRTQSVGGTSRTRDHISSETAYAERHLSKILSAHEYDEQGVDPSTDLNSMDDSLVHFSSQDPRVNYRQEQAERQYREAFRVFNVAKAINRAVSPVKASDDNRPLSCKASLKRKMLAGRPEISADNNNLQIRDVELANYVADVIYLKSRGENPLELRYDTPQERARIRNYYSTRPSVKTESLRPVKAAPFVYPPRYPMFSDKSKLEATEPSLGDTKGVFIAQRVSSPRKSRSVSSSCNPAPHTLLSARQASTTDCTPPPLRSVHDLLYFQTSQDLRERYDRYHHKGGSRQPRYCLSSSATGPRPSRELEAMMAPPDIPRPKNYREHRGVENNKERDYTFYGLVSDYSSSSRSAERSMNAPRSRSPRASLRKTTLHGGTSAARRERARARREAAEEVFMSKYNIELPAAKVPKASNDDKYPIAGEIPPPDLKRKYASTILDTQPFSGTDPDHMARYIRTIYNRTMYPEPESDFMHTLHEHAIAKKMNDTIRRNDLRRRLRSHSAGAHSTNMHNQSPPSSADSTVIEEPRPSGSPSRLSVPSDCRRPRSVGRTDQRWRVQTMLNIPTSISTEVMENAGKDAADVYTEMCASLLNTSQKLFEITRAKGPKPYCSKSDVDSYASASKNASRSSSKTVASTDKTGSVKNVAHDTNISGIPNHSLNNPSSKMGALGFSDFITSDVIGPIYKPIPTEVTAKMEALDPSARVVPVETLSSARTRGVTEHAQERLLPARMQSSNILEGNPYLNGIRSHDPLLIPQGSLHDCRDNYRSARQATVSLRRPLGASAAKVMSTNGQAGTSTSVSKPSLGSKNDITTPTPLFRNGRSPTFPGDAFRLYSPPLIYLDDVNNIPEFKRIDL